MKSTPWGRANKKWERGEREGKVKGVWGGGRRLKKHNGGDSSVHTKRKRQQKDRTQGGPPNWPSTGLSPPCIGKGRWGGGASKRKGVKKSDCLNGTGCWTCWWKGTARGGHIFETHARICCKGPVGGTRGCTFLSRLPPKTHRISELWEGDARRKRGKDG